MPSILSSHPEYIMANHQRDHAKERYWRRTLRQFRRSGLSVRDYCRQHHLAEPVFYAWRRTIAQRDREAVARRAARRADTPTAPPAFVPINVVPDGPAAVEVVLGRGRIVRVTAGFDAALLVRVVAALEDAAC